MAGGVLFLDLAAQVGWAYGREGDSPPLVGAWQLPVAAADPGRFFALFNNALLDALTIHDPEYIGVEARLPAIAQKSEAAAVNAIGLWAILAETAWRWERRLVQRSSGTIRSAVIGRGRFGKGEAKDAVEAWCVSQGWNIPNHNARDAAVGWAYEVGFRATKASKASAA